MLLDTLVITVAGHVFHYCWTHWSFLLLDTFFITVGHIGHFCCWTRWSLLLYSVYVCIHIQENYYKFPIIKPTRCTNVSNLFYFGMTLHVSDGLSVHHQQFKTVNTATGNCQTDTAVCLLASRQQYLFGCCMYSLELLMMDGKTVRNM